MYICIYTYLNMLANYSRNLHTSQHFVKLTLRYMHTYIIRSLRLLNTAINQATVRSKRKSIYPFI